MRRMNSRTPPSHPRLGAGRSPRAPDAARLAALRDELAARGTDGVEWRLVDVDALAAERLLAGG